MSESTDRIEITEVLNRHQIYIDLADAEGYARLYASDVSYTSPFASATGRKKIAEMFQSVRASGFTVNKRHFNGPSMIEIKEDRAAHYPTCGSLTTGTNHHLYSPLLPTKMNCRRSRGPGKLPGACSRWT